mgnify:CR=1
MKIPVVKKLVENHSLEALVKAEAMILEDEVPTIEIEGEDQGEQLTHVIAAQWILKDMRESGDEARVSLRKYTQKVRNSIS